MQRNLIMTQPLSSSFLSCEKDTETILRKLFIESRPYSDILKRLLVVQAQDALDETYNMDKYTLKTLIDEGYIVLSPKVEFDEHEQVKSFIVLNFDTFLPTSNPEFRDCIVCIYVVCHSDFWMLKNYQQRPFKILGYIDGILNNTKLSGIGELLFEGCKETIVNQDWSFYTLTYRATHGSDDKIPVNEE